MAEEERKKEKKKRKFFFFSKAMGSSMVDVKASRSTFWWLNTMPNQALDIWILWFNGKDQIVWSENYSCSSIRVASIDENKNRHRKITIINYRNHIIAWMILALNNATRLLLLPFPTVNKQIIFIWLNDVYFKIREMDSQHRVEDMRRCLKLKNMNQQCLC